MRNAKQIIDKIKAKRFSYKFVTCYLKSFERNIVIRARRKFEAKVNTYETRLIFRNT